MPLNNTAGWRVSLASWSVLSLAQLCPGLSNSSACTATGPPPSLPKPGTAAGAFSAFTFMTLPMAFLTPLIAARLKHVFPLAAALSIVYPIGYIGLVLAPGGALVWALIMGLGGGAFLLAITMTMDSRVRSVLNSVPQAIPEELLATTPPMVHATSPAGSGPAVEHRDGPGVLADIHQQPVRKGLSAQRGSTGTTTARGASR